VSALWFILAGLAAARTWRLLAVDGAGQPARGLWHRLALKVHGDSMAGRRYRIANSMLEGFYCPFCLGFWLTAAWVGTGLAWHDTWPWQLAAGSFALSYVAGHLGAHFDKDAIDEDEVDLNTDLPSQPNLDYYPEGDGDVA
jgi:thiosulfate reductase cytochrome b subunit